MILMELVITFIFFNLKITAHEEPPKTIREREKKEQERIEVLKNKVISYIVWKHKIKNNEPDLLSKEKFLIVLYDQKGNISEMQVYKHYDTLDSKVFYEYDENNNMIRIVEYDSDGKIVERIEYRYDDFGRVLEQVNYEKENKIDSKFTYLIDNNNNAIILNKYKPLDSIEYQIIYKYQKNIDSGNNIEIIKQKPNGKLIMRVENVFDENNRRIQKKVFDEGNNLVYYFDYTYIGKEDKISTITKYSPEKKVLSKTYYTFNDFGFIATSKSVDESGNVVYFYSYDYKIEK